MATLAFKEPSEKAANVMAAEKFLGLFGRKIGKAPGNSDVASDQLVLEPWELWSDSGEKPANWKSLQKIYWDWGGWRVKERPAKLV